MTMRNEVDVLIEKIEDITVGMEKNIKGIQEGIASRMIEIEKVEDFTDEQIAQFDTKFHNSDKIKKMEKLFDELRSLFS